MLLKTSLWFNNERMANSVLARRQVRFNFKMSLTTWYNLLTIVYNLKLFLISFSTKILCSYESCEAVAGFKCPIMLQIQLLHRHNGILPSLKCEMEMAVLKELGLPKGHWNDSSLPRFAQIISKLPRMPWMHRWGSLKPLALTLTYVVVIKSKTILQMWI